MNNHTVRATRQFVASTRRHATTGQPEQTMTYHYPPRLGFRDWQVNVAFCSHGEPRNHERKKVSIKRSRGNGCDYASDIHELAEAQAGHASPERRLHVLKAGGKPLRCGGECIGWER